MIINFKEIGGKGVIAYDFRYDGELLSEHGFQLCTFDGSGNNTVSNGSQISFNQISTQGGQKYHLTSSLYEDCLSSVVQICRNNCDGSDLRITQNELRALMQWLNRKEFHELRFIGDPLLENIRFNASFNVSRIEIGGILYGLELEATTDKPFGYGEEVNQTFRLRDIEPEESEESDESEDKTEENEESEEEPVVNTKWFEIESTSDEEGYLYPTHCEIIPFERGDLVIHNTLEDHDVIINNCIIGEHITMEYPMIFSSRADHAIQNDFNWNFFRIANQYKHHVNHYIANLPCNIILTYSPIIKIGF